MSEARPQNPWIEALSGVDLCGRYRLVAPIGLGGAGAVFEAVHLMTGRPVAVKLLLPALAGEEVALKRFEREALTAGQINQRGAVAILDFDRDPRHGPFLVMERLQGESFARRIARAGTLSVEEAFSLILEVTATLEVAHRQGIVHRDLKPANVFLAEGEGGSRAVKLLDFGISRVTASEGATRLTRTGVLLGTVRYMSPEQAKDPKSVDHRADIYAVGAMLYHALSGVKPYDGMPGAMVLLQLLQRPPTPLAELAPWLSESVRQVVERAMAREPGGRYPDVSSLREALSAVLRQGDEVTAMMTAGASAPPPEPGAPSTVVERAPSPPSRQAETMATEVLRPRPSQPRPSTSQVEPALRESRHRSTQAGRAARPRGGPGLPVLVAVLLVAAVLLVVAIGAGAAWVATHLTREGTGQARLGELLPAGAPSQSPSVAAEGPPNTSFESTLDIQLALARQNLREGEPGIARQRVRSMIERLGDWRNAPPTSARRYRCKGLLLLGEIATSEVVVDQQYEADGAFYAAIDSRYRMAAAQFDDALAPCSPELEACFHLKRGELEERYTGLVFERLSNDHPGGLAALGLQNTASVHYNLASSLYTRCQNAAIANEACQLECHQGTARVEGNRARFLSLLR